MDVFTNKTNTTFNTIFFFLKESNYRYVNLTNRKFRIMKQVSAFKFETITDTGTVPGTGTGTQLSL
jgi:hypothetical protein